MRALKTLRVGRETFMGEEKKKSVLLRDLMLYLKVITVNFKQEMDTVFSDNPRLKREIEYDLRKFDESGEGVFETNWK